MIKVLFYITLILLLISQCSGQMVEYPDGKGGWQWESPDYLLEITGDPEKAPVPPEGATPPDSKGGWVFTGTYWHVTETVTASPEGGMWMNPVIGGLKIKSRRSFCQWVRRNPKTGNLWENQKFLFDWTEFRTKEISREVIPGWGKK